MKAIPKNVSITQKSISVCVCVTYKHSMENYGGFLDFESSFLYVVSRLRSGPSSTAVLT